MDLYQSLVAVEPVTLITQICNLFIQLFLFKKLLYDKIVAILDKRREAADKQITEAESAKQEALTIKKTYEQNMLEAKQQAEDILSRANRTAAARSEEMIGQARQEATRIKQKAASDIAQEKKKAINDAKDEISGISMAIAEKVVERQLDEKDQQKLVEQFIDRLGESL